MGDFSGCVEGRHMAKAGWKRLSLRSVTNSFIAGICYEASQEGGWREEEAQPADLPLHLEGSGHCTRGHGAQCPHRAALGTHCTQPSCAERQLRHKVQQGLPYVQTPKSKKAGG